MAERRFFMDFNRLMRFMPDETKEKVNKVIDTLRIGGRSEKTILNYVHAIIRFLKYFQNEDISAFTEDAILISAVNSLQKLVSQPGMHQAYQIPLL